MPNKLRLLTVLVLSLPAVNAFALQPLSDDALAESTGQDGITIGIGAVNGVIGFDEIGLTDTDGLSDPFYSGDYNKPASISYITQGSGAGIGFYSGVTGSTPITQPLSFIVDADGNGSNRVLNAGIKLSSALTRINLSPFSISLKHTSDPIPAAGGNPAVSAKNYRRDLLQVGGSGIDILLNSGSAVGINLQLGAEPQGHMFVFTGGQIKEIRNDPSSPIQVLSYSAACSTTCVSSSSLNFNFNLKANAASTNGIQLAGMYVDINSEGLTLGKTGPLDKFDFTLSNLVAGKLDELDTNTFDGLKNGSMGNFGVIGATVTNLKVNVKGM